MQQPAPPPQPQPPVNPTHHQTIKNHPERITQLQCLNMNSQLNAFFVHALNDSFKYLPTVLEYVYNQIQLLVSLGQYRLTIGNGKPHSGDSLQNIQFKDSVLTRKVKLLYLFLTVILPYLKKKVYGYLMKNPTGWREKLIAVINYVDKVLMALHLINLSIFIRFGKYRTLSQRILKIPMQFINGESARILDFSLMNRRIIWTVYQLFLKTVLPYAHDIIGPTLKNIFYLASYQQPDQAIQADNCVYCQQRVRMPMRANCSHMACYFCYSTNRDVEEGDKNKEQEVCRRCGVRIAEWKKMY